MCPPEAEPVFKKWFDEELILIKSFKDLLGITRYQLVRAADIAEVKTYPQYLSVYRFTDPGVINNWKVSPELANSRKGWQEVCAPAGMRVLWDAQYESVQTWQKTRPHSVITVSGIRCPSRSEPEFGAWYSFKHISSLLKFKWLLGVAHYRFYSGELRASETLIEYPNHLTFYHFDSTRAAEVFDTSPEYLASREDWLKMAKSTGASALWRAEYEPAKTWQR